jgi:molecular chaperone DnaK (HSP70)
VASLTTARLHSSGVSRRLKPSFRRHISFARSLPSLHELGWPLPQGLLAQMTTYDCTIGIDLGTTSTCTAVFRDGRIEIVPHEGYLSMPSYVTFKMPYHVVGVAARDMAEKDPANTIFGVLPLIGKRFSDTCVQDAIAALPFRVIDVDGWPSFAIYDSGEKDKECMLTPNEIIAMILGRARRDAQKYLGPSHHIKGVVITVPARFGSHQRQIVRDAAATAGLGPSCTISAAIMTCVDYVFKSRPHPRGKMLTIDIGAEFVDAAVVDVVDLSRVAVTQGASILEMKAVDGDSGLGGKSIDSSLVNLLLSTVEHPIQEATPAEARPPMLIHHLRAACEQAKHESSSHGPISVKFEQISDRGNLEFTISQEAFDECCRRLLDRVVEIIAMTMSAAEVQICDLRTVIITGGSSRLSVLEQGLRSLFRESRLQQSLNNSTAAQGAAIFAAYLCGYTDLVLLGRPTHTLFQMESDAEVVSTPDQSTPGSVSFKSAPQDHVCIILEHANVQPSTIAATLEESAHVAKMSASTAESALRLKELERYHKFKLREWPELGVIHRSSGAFIATPGVPKMVEHDNYNRPRHNVHPVHDFRYGTYHPNQRSKSVRKTKRLKKPHPSRLPAPNYTSMTRGQIQSNYYESATDTLDFQVLPTADSIAPSESRSCTFDDSDTTCQPSPSLSGLPPDSGGPPDEDYLSDFQISPTPSLASSIIFQEDASPVTESLDTDVSASQWMQDMFSSPNDSKATFTDAEFLRISTYLDNMGRPSWSRVPRLYTVLRLINLLDLLDLLDIFIDQSMRAQDFLTSRSA